MPLSNRELWRPIDGYEGLYSVSSDGSVRTEHAVVETDHGPKRQAGKQLNVYRTEAGEPYVYLHKGPTVKACYTKALLKSAFPLVEGEVN